MFIFNLFKKKKNHPSDKISLDKIWNMWENDSVPSPYRELMTYQAEVNNGGHMQFFDNVSNTEDLGRVAGMLQGILTGNLLKNFTKAYDSYKNMADAEDTDPLFDILDTCDDVYYENESEINRLLEEYARSLK